VPGVKDEVPTEAGGPPEFLRLAGHPVRWRLLCELVRSDLPVRELTALVGERQSLVSYHLGLLRSAEVVSVRRSSADGRDSYYSISLARCGELLEQAGGELHPALQLVAPLAPTATSTRSVRRRRVLFLCTGNGARSQMAEALLDARSNGTVDVVSAGSHPKPVNPTAIRVMDKRGIDISAKRSKHYDEFAGQRFDLVITLCDRVREVCPEFPGHPRRRHWSIPDPSSEGAGQRVFAQVADDLDTRIRFLIHEIPNLSTRRSPAHG
jgi:ArsR family transcriptional regulator, arsenate/arsenite/antimonite-responsive transcriptional repressor / arsenate reductase (thioredoxin)